MRLWIGPQEHRWSQQNLKYSIVSDNNDLTAPPSVWEDSISSNFISSSFINQKPSSSSLHLPFNFIRNNKLWGHPQVYRTRNCLLVGVGWTSIGTLYQVWVGGRRGVGLVWQRLGGSSPYDRTGPPHYSGFNVGWKDLDRHVSTYQIGPNRIFLKCLLKLFNGVTVRSRGMSFMTSHDWNPWYTLVDH